MRRQTDRMKDRTKPGMSLKSSKSSTVGTAFRSAAPGGRQSQEAPNARGASRKPLVQSAPKGPNGPQTPKRKETSNAGKDQQPQDSKIQVPTEEHKVQPDQHHQPRKLRQRSRIRTMRSVSFDRSTRSTPGDSYEVEILITEPFLTVNIEDEFLPRHLRREMTWDYLRWLENLESTGAVNESSWPSWPWPSLYDFKFGSVDVMFVSNTISLETHKSTREIYIQ